MNDTKDNDRQVEEPAIADGALLDEAEDIESEESRPAELIAPPSADDDEDGERGPATRSAKMVGVRFADGKVMDFDPGGLDLRQGDTVVVDNERNLNLGDVVFRADNIKGKRLRRVLRRVTPQDLLLLRRNEKREEEALDFCKKRVEERKLPMKLISVAYLHGGNKAVFFFTADGRVDFRSLVRDLAQQLHVRIEMRQIGVRDEAKMLGGMGICGQPLCCARYLRKFVPVSIKMAKNQNLALNPQKVSGLCGRLMCCLTYEEQLYMDLRKGLPKVGKITETPRGKAKILEVDVLAGRMRVLLEDGPANMTVAEFRGEEPPPAPESRPQSQSVSERGPRSRRAPRARPARDGEPGKSSDRSSEKAPQSAPEKEGEAEGGRSGRGRKRRRKKTPAAEQARPEAQVQDGKPSAAEGEKKADASERKRRSRRRSQRRKKKRPGSDQAGGAGGSDSGGAGKQE